MPSHSIFLGEYFFKTGKTRRAGNYLDRAYELSPRDRRVSLLLGLTCADEGNVERAKELLSSATRLGGFDVRRTLWTGPVVHCGSAVAQRRSRVKLAARQQSFTRSTLRAWFVFTTKCRATGWPLVISGRPWS